MCITVHRQATLLLVVESGTRKFSCLSVECLSVESGTYGVIFQFCTVKGMFVESEVLKAQNCALSKLSLPMHCNVFFGWKSDGCVFLLANLSIAIAFWLTGSKVLLSNGTDFFQREILLCHLGFENFI